MNTSDIVRFLRDCGASSCSELAREFKLSYSEMYNLLSRLVKRGTIRRWCPLSEVDNPVRKGSVYYRID